MVPQAPTTRTGLQGPLHVSSHSPPALEHCPVTTRAPPRLQRGAPPCRPHPTRHQPVERAQDNIRTGASLHWGGCTVGRLFRRERVGADGEERHTEICPAQRNARSQAEKTSNAIALPRKRASFKSRHGNDPVRPRATPQPRILEFPAPWPLPWGGPLLHSGTTPVKLPPRGSPTGAR